MNKQTLLEEYQKCNQRIAESFDKLNNKHPLYLCGVYTELLTKGYFSYQHQFQKKHLNFAHSSLSIFTGKGNNIQISNHLKDILDIMNISSKTIKLPPLWQFFLTEYPLSPENFYTFILKNQFISFIPFRNRHINSIEYNRITYWLDIKNNTYFSQYISDPIFNEFIKFFSINNFAESLNTENYFNNGSNDVIDNLSTFNKLYEANKESYEKIALTLNQSKYIISKILSKNKVLH